MYEHKDNSGSLFRNDKGDNPARPDYRGEIKINGVVYELASWIKEGAKGKFMSLSAKPKEQAKPAAKPKSVMDIPDDDLDELIPF